MNPSFKNNQHYLEAGTELTFQTTAWSLAYRVLHAPVDQGFLKYSKDVCVRFQRRWTCWLAPDWRVGSAGISTGWSAGFRSQISL